MTEIDPKEQQILQLLQKLGERDRQIQDIKEGFEGCCQACEPVGILNEKLDFQVKAKDQEIAQLKEQLAALRKELAVSEFRKESYVKDSWRAAAERDEARRQLCVMLADRATNPDETPEKIAEQKNWQCFDSFISNRQQTMELRIREFEKRNEIADEILGSEQFMWLMVGANYVDQHLRDIRPAWTAWIDAGGKSYGKRR